MTEVSLHSIVSQLWGPGVRLDLEVRCVLRMRMRVRVSAVAFRTVMHPRYDG